MQLSCHWCVDVFVHGCAVPWVFIKVEKLSIQRSKCILAPFSAKNPKRIPQIFQSSASFMTSWMTPCLESHWLVIPEGSPLLQAFSWCSFFSWNLNTRWGVKPLEFDQAGTRFRYEHMRIVLFKTQKCQQVEKSIVKETLLSVVCARLELT